MATPPPIDNDKKYKQKTKNAIQVKKKKGSHFCVKKANGKLAFSRWNSVKKNSTSCY